jgi:hypothetical protein
LSDRLADHLTLKRGSKGVIEATKQLFVSHPDGTFTGRGNTKQDIKDRIDLYRDMLSDILS